MLGFSAVWLSCLLQKAADRQRVRRAPRNPAFRVDAFEVADQQQAEVAPGCQARSAHLVSDQNVKTYYENNRRGYRISTSVGGAVTGKGGDCLVLDDPHNLKTIDSPAERASAIGFFRNVWSQRFNDAKRGHHVIVMQRGHEDDLASLVMERGGFEHLNLPSEYERTPFVIVSGEKIAVEGFAGDTQERDEVIATMKREHRKATIEDKVQVSAIGWQDPRDKDGELLWTERFGPEEITAAKRDLLETGFATQHQQLSGASPRARGRYTPDAGPGRAARGLPWPPRARDTSCAGHRGTALLNSAGVRSPRLMWGRSSLSCRRQCSIPIQASVRFRNHSSDRHSFRNFPMTAPWTRAVYVQLSIDRGSLRLDV